MSGTHPHPIFLFGAGASVPATLPTSFDLTDRFIDKVRATEDDPLCRALSLVLGAMHMLRGQTGRFPAAGLNVEDLAATLDALRARQEHLLSPFVGTWHEMVGLYDGSRTGASRNCLRELSNMLQSGVREWLQTPPIGKLRYLQCLQGFIKEFQHIDVFTLNYDLCVESALSECGVSFTCGFTSAGWDTTQFERIATGVSLYKLHGSLDWYRDPEDRTVYSTHWPPEDRVPAGDFMPLLIFGTGNKMKAVDPFLFLSYTFAERVKAASVVTVVGYGFGDDYVNDILDQGFARDSRKRLVVVGRDTRSAEETCRQKLALVATLIDAGRASFVGGGAESALNEGTMLDAVRNAHSEATTEGPF